jgi:hypothetical protein
VKKSGEGCVGLEFLLVFYVVSSFGVQEDSKRCIVI